MQDDKIIVVKKRILFFCFIFLLLILGIVAFIFWKNGVFQKVSKSKVMVNAERKIQVDGLKYYYEPYANSRPKFSSNFAKENATYTINEDALNERKNYNLLKPQKTFRIITLGDSFTFGLYVDTKDNWTELLEDMLNKRMKCGNIDKFEVINLGIWGYDIQYSVERYKLRGKKYNPDLIIWLIVDLLRMNEELRGKMFALKEQYDKQHKKIENVYEPFIKARNETIQRLGKGKILEYQQTEFQEIRKY